MSDAKGLMRWFSPAARVTPGVGSKFWTSWGEGMNWLARITIWQTEQHLRAESDGTPEYNSTKHGWDVFVRTLKHALEIPFSFVPVRVYIEQCQLCPSPVSTMI